MDKIKELLAALGASSELSKSICEELDRYSAALKENTEKEMKEKVAKVKEICVEEVQKEKINLARKLGIYLESKSESIERAMKKQRVTEESEATSVLKKAKSVLEGIEIGGEVSNRELRSLEKQAERLEKAIGTIKEERDRAVGKANKANEIAVKMLKKNQLYEAKLKRAGLLAEGGQVKCECGTVLGEGEKVCKDCTKDPKDTKEPKAKTGVCEKCKKPGNLCKCESKDRFKAALTESRRLDTNKKPIAAPRSTRRTLVESEIPRPVSGGSTDITKIASEMPE